MTKILQIITLSEWGGAQRVLYDLATNLDRNKFLVEVACSPEGLLVKKLKEQGIAVLEIPSLGREISPWRDLKTFIALYRLIKKGKYDIVHCHSTKAGFLGRIAAKFAGVKKIYFTAHGWGFYNQEEYGKINWLFVLAEKIAAKFSTKIICVSEKGKEDALKLKIAPENKFLVIKNGIDFTPLEISGQKNSEGKNRKLFLTGFTLGPSRQKLEGDQIVIGMVARPAYPKDPLMFLRAAKEIKNRLPQTKFVLVGAGILISECQDFVSENKLDSVMLLGEKTPEETRRLLLSFDIFVLCSKFEGLPITIIEAMFAGLPIIASNVGGIGELVKDGRNGFLIGKENPAQLAEKIIYLIKNPQERIRMGQNSLAIAQANFTLEKMLRDYEKLY